MPPNPMLSIHIMFFASLAQRLGLTETDIALPAPATVRQACETLLEKFPKLAGAADNLAFAVNMTYVDPDHPLCDGDELALIPPVSGG